ncbi:uncharacterized protein [Anoplolepis gracilipes]|uniref:uncharacterized protein n=1 Tax=Anoplolepis gracilipes TaxID=354296 RepID=UPI003BA20C80
MFTKILTLTLVAIINLQEIYGHGVMMDPINRASAWRKGFPVPPNYTDNEYFCGGREVQIQNGGKCGECGDNYALPRPRSNENGGTYGTGVIVEKYKAGSTINVEIHLTASHMGYFEFNLCPLQDKKDLETEKCFKDHPLLLADGSGYKFPVTGPKTYNVKVILPKDVTCEQCVFRWHYRTGNFWGKCEDGSEGMGCGPQENYINCADVSITN